MIRFISTGLFFLSVFFGPWWLFAALAVFLLAEWRDFFSVILGAMIVDLLFGIPIVQNTLLPFLYIGIFVPLILIELFLRRRVLD